ncbi:MAG: hypothetical protein Q7S89_03500 [bacterium]|nr:hypothetical protein [bacterium]
MIEGRGLPPEITGAYQGETTAETSAVNERESIASARSAFGTLAEHPIPIGDARFHTSEYYPRMDALATREGSWVRAIGQNLFRFGRDIENQAGVASSIVFLDELIRKKAAAHAEAGHAWSADPPNDDEKRLIAQVTKAGIDEAIEYIAKSELPEEMKQLFLANAAVADDVVERLDRIQNSSEFEVYTDILLPILEVRAGQLTERLKGEYQERYLEPTIDAIGDLFPMVNRDELIRRGKRTKIEAVPRARQLVGTSIWNDVAADGTYDGSSRTISIPSDIVEQSSGRADLDHVVTHETLHALSHPDKRSTTLWFWNKKPTEDETYGTPVRDFSSMKLREVSHFLTEAVTETLTGKVLERRNLLRSKDQLTYVLPRGMLATHLTRFDNQSETSERLATFEEVAAVYFGDEKDLYRATVKDKRTRGWFTMLEKHFASLSKIDST